METGYDILFFWVARMIMMGLEFTGKAPFHKVYLHGLVRDGDGRKMSKSLGNVIDPLQVMDEFGTDALRFTLLTGSTPGNDMNLSLQRVEANRNFANKLWNAARLVLMAVERAPEAPGQAPDMTPVDRWITARQARLEREVDRLLAGYQFGEAGRQVYEFFWSEFADWYLEVGKLQLELGGGRAWLTTRIMVDVLDTCLRLLHPFTPFVTESLWGHLKAACQAQAKGFGPQTGWEDALIVAGWPEAPGEEDGEEEAVQAFENVMAVIRAVRNLRSERGVEPSRQIAALIQAGDQTELFESQRQTLSALAHIDADRLEIHEHLDEAPDHAIPLVVGTIEVFLPSAELFDVDVERQRLQAEMAEIQGQIERLEGLLSGAFAERAPQDVVEKERGRLQDYRLTYGKLQSQVDALS
jgi:valyl-tRNA synthetase